MTRLGLASALLTLTLPLASPAAALTREELCYANAYNFAVVLGLRDRGATRAEAREMLLGMIEGADRRITGAVDGIVADAWAWRGATDQSAEDRYRRACMAG